MIDTSNVGNRLFAKFGAADLATLATHTDRIALEIGDLLIEPNEPVRYVWFPETALASLVIVLEDGSTVESGAVGREGMVGIPILLGTETTPMQTVTQVSGDALRIPAGVIRELYARGGALQTLLNRYVNTAFIVASQSAACNRRHQVDERLARWLLMSSDGIGSDDIAITQEYLATMLGVRRAGVTEAALALQERGLIQYRRGFIAITNRPELEDAACECYRIVHEQYESMLG
jgi:CRP-like cAMP-binding protein